MMTNCQTIMIQGTTSDAGKTTLVAGLCRLFADKQVKVAPFKPQNMALNSAVTPCGGEIGRAQALQAKAARVALSVDFNPILLKPNSDTGAQVIVHGKALSNMEAESYHDYKKVAMQAVLHSHKKLKENYQLIVVEGAGSPAEVNLREGDIANMGFAEAVDCPVIIVADIDKGGVFAQLVGTLMLLSQSEQDRVIGFVINRFRGDISLLEPGLEWLERKTNKPVLGVLPYLHGLDISSEDALTTSQSYDKANTKVEIVVLVYPHMSNHTDFDILRHHPHINCQFLFAKNEKTKVSIPACDLIILPGSKNVRSDLAFLYARGWHQDIARHLRYGGKLIGICGGYQMLGQVIHDPHAIEGQAGSSKGLGYFPIETELASEKTLVNAAGTMMLGEAKSEVSGYEIHAGVTQLLTNTLAEDKPSAMLTLGGEEQGFVSNDQQIAGCYLHGLFDNPSALQLLISWLGLKTNIQPSLDSLEEEAIERVSHACEQYLAIDKLTAMLQSWR
ncbi:cobyric acid synthase [Litorilituus sediminis]|nr:cobyric acid synthase [Litorilituus sediminis]